MNDNFSYKLKQNTNNQNKFNDYSDKNTYSNKQQNCADSPNSADAQIIYATVKNESTYIKPMIVLFLTSFFSMFVFGVFYNHFEENLIRIIQLLFMGLILIVESFVTFAPVIKSNIRKNRCSYSITAKILDIKEIFSGENISAKTTTYKYCYKGKIYIITANSTNDLVEPEVGQEVDLFINSNTPTEFYIEPTVGDVNPVAFNLFVLVFTICLFMLIAV